MSRSRLAEHFESLERQHEAARLGMWIFLASEALLFAGFFALWGAYHARYPVAFAEAATHNALLLGTLNTVILVTSSFVIATAVWALEDERAALARGCVWATAGLGVVFLSIKGVEYVQHVHEGLLPGAAFAGYEPQGPGAPIFFALYWSMTGLHALHMLGAIVVMLWLARRIASGATDPEHPIALEVGAMYWHLVDIVWLFLWPLLYLLR